ncbi:MAG: hypothetical protein ACRDRQ_12870 [Pseudonocardiaceae bacterium]
MRLLFLVAVLLLAGAGGAAAHDVTGDGSTGVASDARSSVVADDLPPGVMLEVLQNGLALRLRNGSPALVAVRDPGLQVAPGSSVQWHLDAAHPSPGPPVQPWQVIIEVNGVPHHVLGEVRWTPGPSPWPWLAAAALLAAGLGAVVWRAGKPAWLVVPLAAAILTSIGHTAAALAARTAEGPRWALLGDYLPESGCWVLGAVAVVLLARGRAEADGLGALAAAGLVLVTLVRAGAVLGASTVLVALPADLDRALVTGTAGLATGVFAGLVARQRNSLP